MSTNNDKVSFLLQHPKDLSGQLQRRTINALISDGCETLFSALAKTESFLKRTPNMGAKSVSDFIQFIQAHGFEPGDTEVVFEKYRPFFTCENAPGLFPQIIDKKISPIPTIDRQAIYIEDYKTKIEEYLNPNLEQRMQNALTARQERDISWITSLLPENLRQLGPEFNKLALTSPEFESELLPLREQIKALAVKAVQRQMTRG